MEPPSASFHHQRRTTKRASYNRACLTCSRSKKKCSGNIPCNRCSRLNIHCTENPSTGLPRNRGDERNQSYKRSRQQREVHEYSGLSMDSRAPLQPVMGNYSYQLALNELTPASYSLSEASQPSYVASRLYTPSETRRLPLSDACSIYPSLVGIKHTDYHEGLARKHQATFSAGLSAYPYSTDQIGEIGTSAIEEPPWTYNVYDPPTKAYDMHWDFNALGNRTQNQRRDLPKWKGSSPLGPMHTRQQLDEPQEYISAAPSAATIAGFDELAPEDVSSVLSADSANARRIMGHEGPPSENSQHTKLHKMLTNFIDKHAPLRQPTDAMEDPFNEIVMSACTLPCTSCKFFDNGQIDIFMNGAAEDLFGYTARYARDILTQQKPLTWIHPRYAEAFKKLQADAFSKMLQSYSFSGKFLQHQSLTNVCDPANYRQFNATELLHQNWKCDGRLAAVSAIFIVKDEAPRALSGADVQLLRDTWNREEWHRPHAGQNDRMANANLEAALLDAPERNNSFLAEHVASLKGPTTSFLRLLSLSGGG